jgi:hypothetical protein
MENAMTDRNPGLFGGNRFKLGVFGANCSGGLSLLSSGGPATGTTT